MKRNMIRKPVFGLLLSAVFLIAVQFASAADHPNMVYVDGGNGIMGAEYGDLLAKEDAKPIHRVDLTPYYIDNYEVSNADYALCVAVGECEEPKEKASKTREDYYGNPIFDRFPVVNVTWQDAADYCEFVGKRLPTEAEWERAARGNNDNRRYPWGNGSPKSHLMNTTSVPGDTEMPNSYDKGNSPYNVSDMIANVSEWVSDWYDAETYVNSESKDPSGPASGTEKVVRGDSFETLPASVNATNRYKLDPESWSNTIGFRCAKDILDIPEYEENESDGPEPEYGYIKAGNENGIFLIDEPGDGNKAALAEIIPNGAVVELLVGPVAINYSNWYQVQTEEGTQGWTLANAVIPFDAE